MKPFTQAAIHAGYSKKTAWQIGEENLSKPDIADATLSLDNRRRFTRGRADFLGQLGRDHF